MLHALAFLLAAGVAVQGADPALRVALYAGEGTSSSLDGVRKALAGMRGVTVREVGPDEIAAGALKSFDVVLHPGGSGGTQGRALGETGRAAERAFLAAGGGYVGICAGAYLATGDYAWSLHLINAHVVDRAHWARGKGDVTVALTEAGRGLLGAKADSQAMRYLQGPLLAPGQEEDLPAFQPLATFTTEIAQKGAPSGVMVGTVAVAAGTFQKGRVVCFSPHPEKRPDQWSQLHHALVWAAHREVVSSIGVAK